MMRCILSEIALSQVCGHTSGSLFLGDRNDHDHRSYLFSTKQDLLLLEAFFSEVFREVFFFASFEKGVLII